MAAARRALAAPSLRRLPLLRPAAPARPAVLVAPAAAARILTRPPAVAPPCCWYSVGGSCIWTFDEVKRQVEVNSRGPGSKGEQKVVFVDVREHDELAATGKIPGAVCMPLMTAPQLVEQPGNDEVARSHGLQPAPQPRDAHLVFYCHAGVRARTAAQMASRAGWPSVGEYPGSWLEWEERAGPVEKVPSE